MHPVHDVIPKAVYGQLKNKNATLVQRGTTLKVSGVTAPVIEAIVLEALRPNNHFARLDPDTVVVLPICRRHEHRNSFVLTQVSFNAGFLSRRRSEAIAAQLLGNVVHPSFEVKGKEIKRETFCQNPLFRGLPETDWVFNELAKLASTDGFARKYALFLTSLRRENWFEGHEADPIGLALYAHIAYLDGKMSWEELAVIHTLADAMRERSRDGIESYRPVVLTGATLGPYLTDSGYPPFAPNRAPFLITNRKPEARLVSERDEMIRRFSRRSPVLRTVVEYRIRGFKLQLREGDRNCSVEEAIFSLGVRVGYRDSVNPDGPTMVLLPPDLAISLYQAAAAVELNVPPASSHTFTFGYHPRNTPFFNGGRAIAIPSPLTDFPRPHDYSEGPPGLGCSFHDNAYHLPMDAQNPHRGLLTQIAIGFRDFQFPAQMDESTRQAFQGASAKAADYFVDREAREYSSSPPAICLSIILNREINERMKDFFVFIGRPDLYPRWVNEVANVVIRANVPNPDPYLRVLVADRVRRV